MNRPELTWQEWLEIKNYELPPPNRAPLKHEFEIPPLLPVPILFPPLEVMPPYECFAIGPGRPTHNHVSGSGRKKGGRSARGRVRDYSNLRFRNLFWNPYQNPYQSGGTGDHMTGFDGRFEGFLMPDPSIEMMFMPLGKPGILLNQNLTQNIKEQIPTLPDDIHNTILELEKDTKPEKFKKFPKISCLDDSYLQNELDEMTDISPLCESLNESRDSGINSDSPPSPHVIKPDKNSRDRQSSGVMSHRVSHVMTSPKPEKSHVCPNCSKKYLSNSGLKYHLKKATNSCNPKPK
jgi:hypothetical protein